MFTGCLQVVYRRVYRFTTVYRLFTGGLQAVYRLFTVLHYSDTITESHYCASQGWQIRDTRIIRNTDSERIIRELILGRGASSQNTDFSRPDSNEIINLVLDPTSHTYQPYGSLVT